MNKLLYYFLPVVCFLLSPVPESHAGPRDDYFLDRFGIATGTALHKAVLVGTNTTPETPRCGTPLKHELSREWNTLESSTRKLLAKHLAAPVLSGEAVFTSPGGNFSIHYATSGVDMPPLADADFDSVPDWVETVAATFENVYTAYQTRNYYAAPTMGGIPYAVYLSDLAPEGYYGMTTAPVTGAVPSQMFPNAYTSYIEIDNDYLEAIFQNSISGTYSISQKALMSLQLTAAHEYHHAIQFGYNVFFDDWFAEATATWYEDELYDDINQAYNYIANWFRNPSLSLDSFSSQTATTYGTGYGRWIFNRFLTEQFGDTIIHDAWTALAPLYASNGSLDIKMAPILDQMFQSTSGQTLGNQLFMFARRIYTRDWISHTADIPYIPVYSPTATYGTYPVNTNSSPTPSVTLPHYSFAFYRFIPSTTATNLGITLTSSSGISAMLFTKDSLGNLSETQFSDGGGYVAVSSTSDQSEAVLLLVNTTDVDGKTASFSTDGSTGTDNTGGSTTDTTKDAYDNIKGSGCFIATAAYGSYLHPQVKVLRDFRDNYLLTNGPGRVFVAWYYRSSPPLADIIAHHTWLRTLVRLALTPLVIFVAYPLASGGALLLAVSSTILIRRHRQNYTLQQPGPAHE